MSKQRRRYTLTKHEEDILRKVEESRGSDVAVQIRDMVVRKGESFDDAYDAALKRL